MRHAEGPVRAAALRVVARRKARATEAGSELRQTAYFEPKGLFGRIYWFLLVPFHLVIFGRMAKRIVAAAEGRRQRSGS